MARVGRTISAGTRQVGIRNFVPPLSQNALLETLTDDFGDSSIDSAKWETAPAADSGAPTEQNGRLEFQGLLNTISFFGLQSLNYYNLTDSYMFAEIKQASSTNGSETDFFVGTTGPQNGFEWHKSGSDASIRCYKYVGGVTTEIAATTYVEADFKFLRIRESGGTVYWDRSPNGVTWVNVTSIATSPVVVVSVKAYLYSGNYATPCTANLSWIDNFNINQAYVPRHAFINHANPGIF